jgi:hypothetical protein
MKKQKKMGGKGVLSCIGSSRVAFEHNTKLLSPFIIIILGLAWLYEVDIVTESSLPIGYSSSPYREFYLCLLHLMVSSFSLCFQSLPYVSCSF